MLVMTIGHHIFCSFCRLEEHESNNEALQAENKKLRTLNIELQKHLLKNINSSTAKCSGRDRFFPHDP